MGKIRTQRIENKDAYINANDLILYLMLRLENAQSDAEKTVIRGLIARVTELKNNE